MFLKRSFAWIIYRGMAVLLIAGLAAAILVRVAPGLDVDERALDPRLSQRSLEALQREHEGELNPFAFYLRYLSHLVRGDAGRSVVFGQPVARLMRERASITIHAVLEGLGIGWTVAILFATLSALRPRPATVLAVMMISGSLLSIPSALLATACLLLRLPPAIAIAGVVFPRVFPHAYEQLQAGLDAPHVVMARARGLSPTRLFLLHVLPAVWIPLVALGGVSLTLAFGASIPIEALADSPGIGQLAWRAALGRDLPVLVGVTLLLTVITVFANMLAEIVTARTRPRAA